MRGFGGCRHRGTTPSRLTIGELRLKSWRAGGKPNLIDSIDGSLMGSWVKRRLFPPEAIQGPEVGFLRLPMPCAMDIEPREISEATENEVASKTANFTKC